MCQVSDTHSLGNGNSFVDMYCYTIDVYDQLDTQFCKISRTRKWFDKNNIFPNSTKELHYIHNLFTYSRVIMNGLFCTLAYL